MASASSLLELPVIHLPPIPGPIPPAFFTHIPPDSAAVFSTVSGTRPLRPLPYPVPVHAVRSGSDEDIRNKAYSLLETYPAIAEPIFTPPATWQDLYYYFDATDLWMEGAGFLFHVVGFIVKVNFARLDYIQNYVRQWALLHESRLAKLPPLQDFLGSLQTPDDQAWFGYDTLSSYEKELLNSTVKGHYDALQAKRIASQVVHRHGPEHFVIGARGSPYDRSTDSYQHFGTQGYKTSPNSSRDISQLMTAYWEANNTRATADFNQHYRDRSTSRSYVGHRGPMNDISHQVALRNVTPIAENQYVPPVGQHQYPIDRRQSIRGVRPSASFQSHPFGLKDPVYVLDPQKSQVSLHNEVVGGDDLSNVRSLPMYSSQWPPNATLLGRNSQEIRGNMQNANNSFTASNDARLHYDNKVSRLDSGAPAMPWHAKHTARKVSWQDSDFNKGHAVYVAGFPMEDSTRDKLEELFSECGDIFHVKVLAEKSCAFINFKYPESVMKAIEQFNGYSTPSGRVLTVQYPMPRSRERMGSYSNRDKQRVLVVEQTQTNTSELPPTSIRNFAVYDGREGQKSAQITHPRTTSYSSFSAPCELSSNPGDQAKNKTDLAHVDMNALESGIQYLPLKPPFLFPSLTGDGSAVTNLNSELDGAQSLMQTPSIMRTPRETQHASIQAQIATECNDSVESPGHGGYGRHDRSGNSKARRKTPKKPKNYPDVSRISKSGDLVDTLNSSQNNIPTSTPVKKASTNSVSYLTAHNGDNSITSRVAVPLPRPQSPVKKSSPAGPEIIIKDDLCQLQGSSNPDSTTECPRMNFSVSSAQNRSEAVSSSEAECIKISEQHPLTCDGLICHKEMLPCDTAPLTTLEVNKIMIVGVLDLLADSKQIETVAELPQQLKKKKAKSKKKSSSISRRSSGEVTTDSVAHLMQDNLLNKGNRNVSKAETRSHFKTDSNTTSSGAISGQSTPIEKGHSTVPGSSTDAKSIEDKQDDSTLSKAPTWQSHQNKKSSQSKANDSDDVFQDKKPTPQLHTRKSQQQSQGKIDLNGSGTPSTGKTNSTAKKTRAQNREESPTPTRQHHSRVRSNKSDKRSGVPDRKENKKLELSASEILSDPLHWPVLGSIKLQVDTRVSNNQAIASLAKPLGERTLQPALLRRDSMASVVSNSPATNSPQPVRRMTIDSPSSPASGGSRLWPVVKRWDSYGQPSRDNNNFGPSSTVST